MTQCHERSTSPLRYVACVSYPRCGHHLAVRIVRHYFDQDFKYCQFYGKNSENCCLQFPCVDPSVTMTKNHDLGLAKEDGNGEQPVPGVPYLVLIRNFLEAAISDYNLFLRREEDSLRAWKTFSATKLKYYKRFLHKWVLNDIGTERLIVQYEQLTSDPVREFSRIIEFFHPPGPIDTERLTRLVQEAALEDVAPDGVRVVQGFGVRNRRRLEEFKHYDPIYFGQLEAELSDEFSSLGYAARFAA